MDGSPIEEPQENAPPTAVYVRDRQSSNGTWVDDKTLLGRTAREPKSYLLHHGQKVSIIGAGVSWIFELEQPATSNLEFRDRGTRFDNDVSLQYVVMSADIVLI